MKKILSVTAVAAGVGYMAAGLAVLAFQGFIKAAMGYGPGYGGMEMANVYPMHNVLELILLGIPCVVLGILSMSETWEGRRGMDLLLIVYGSGMLVVGKLLLNTVGSVINSIFVARIIGTSGLVNMNIVSSVFGWIQFLADLSLVLLLLRGAFSLGAHMGISQTASEDRYDR